MPSKERERATREFTGALFGPRDFLGTPWTTGVQSEMEQDQSLWWELWSETLYLFNLKVSQDFFRYLGTGNSPKPCPQLNYYRG